MGGIMVGYWQGIWEGYGRDNGGVYATLNLIGSKRVVSVI